MNKPLQVLTLIAALGLSGAANAASIFNPVLVDRGGGLIYDTVLNITWLANANLAASDTFAVSGINTNGTMNWNTAQNWIGAMNAANYLGYRDWRLPITSDNCFGYNCTVSEMGHLFYAELGGVAGQSITTTHNNNYNLFQNVQSYLYWSGTVYATYFPSSFDFNFSDGNQDSALNPGFLYAWAVRPGDVTAVPLPAAAWLFGSGLLGLIGVARRKKISA